MLLSLSLFLAVESTLIFPLIHAFSRIVKVGSMKFLSLIDIFFVTFISIYI